MKMDNIKRNSIISGQIFDSERALYGITDTEITDCVFAGRADGESVLKECNNITVKDCRFYLRYPMWHCRDFVFERSEADDKARAALWYCRNGVIDQCSIGCVKALRECHDIKSTGCRIDSEEFGWKCSEIKAERSEINSEYLFFDSRNITLENISMSGKYSFQYTDGLLIENSRLDTKDAFWHSKNTVVRNCTLNGEYIGWYSEGLTLIDCIITGTQPFCYCTGLKLINCRMKKCDLSFEYSDVQAEVIGHIDSIKNPLSGTIIAGSVGEVIRSGSVKECKCRITAGGKEI